ncbi:PHOSPHOLIPASE A1-IBETA2 CHLOROPLASTIC [Salix viminalis]|uniref:PHOSPHOLIPASE A1-IBETA2 CHLOROPLASTIC n=1 Tax=Salix viminalis TaxID=40686 RepID=A0A9Q0QCE6_SALVM|nr:PHOSPHOLIPASE A1-IBETA2 CHLOROPLASTIC [Salix viminalis]
MALQISSTLPAQNLRLFQAKRASFKRQRSTLKPTSAITHSLNYPSTSSSSSSTDQARKHLANLDKLLQKQVPEPLINQTVSQPVHIDSNNGSLAITRGKNLLERLNFARIWPAMKAAEEMSPRHLNRLQRLLSKTEEYSPRNHLGPRWREYHGSNDWKGLLDPLDENLRREVVRYGEFVQAAYHAFHSNPAMSSATPPLPQQVTLPDRSYRVTKSLYATSSVGLPKWVDDVAPDLGWLTQRSSWAGYVAVCEDRREIQRLGRRDIVIALRGTSTCLEWAENMRAQLAEMPGEHDPAETHPKVECGFLSLYKTAGANVPSMSQSVVQEVRRLMELYKGEALSITVTGHSLGAALALLVGDELSTCAPHVPPVAVFSFGGPRVGNKGFANQINAKNVKVLRIVNSQDVITRVPGIPLVEELNDNMPLAYAHVGTELRVDTKTSPYLKPNADVACCHDLEAYLHLVDGFIASNCPFRANAKRSLVKLLTEQGSNVKRLYTSKAQALSLSFERKGLVASGCLPSPS